MKFSEPLHGLRGVASIMVLLAHVSFGYYDHFYRSSAGLGAVVPYVANFGTFGVELFFVISGYVISASCLKYDPLAFAGRRLMRIYPVFAAFTLLYFVLNSFAHYEPARMGIGPLLANLTFLDLFLGTVPLTPNAWSITFEIWYYIATYGLLYFLLRSTATMMTRLVGAILFFVLAGYIIAAFDITVYFAGGALLYFLRRTLVQDIDARTATVTAAAALAVIVVIATLWDFPTRTYLETPGLVVPALLLVCATLVFVQAVIAGPGFFASALTCAPARFVGTISYSLYLTHPYTYLIMRETCKRLHVSSYPWQVTLVPYLAGNLILALGVSWCVHRFIEIAPYKLIYGQRIYRDPLETVAGTAAPDATPVDAARIANGLRP